jgi:hypothetical protein
MPPVGGGGGVGGGNLSLAQQQQYPEYISAPPTNTLLYKTELCEKFMQNDQCT